MTATERGLNEIKSTEGIDCETVMLSGGKVSIWDFAGQIEYTATHQFFLSVEVFFKKIFLFHSIKCCFIFLKLLPSHLFPGSILLPGKKNL